MVLERLNSAFGPAKGLLSAALKTVEMFTGKDNRHYRCCINSKIQDYYYGLAATPETPFNRQKRSLYNNNFTALLGNCVANQPTLDMFSRMHGKSTLQKMLYVDTKSWLPDDLLIKADKMTMATSIELRVPLLDHQLLEFAASLPSKFKVRGKSTKHILKLALQNFVPDKILSRKKTGFPLPFDRWLMTDLRDYVNDTILSPNAALNSYFKKAAVREMVEKQQKYALDHRNVGKGQHALDYSREIFSLLVLELWHKQFRL